MIKKDYYEVLGVRRDSDDAEIKKAYRQMAVKYHPDKNPGDKPAEEKFKEAAEAYEVLSHPEKRQVYNQFGHRGLEGVGFTGFTGMEDIFESFGDIFEDFFGFSGGRRGRGGGRQGADLRYDLEIDFMEACFGTEKQINVARRTICDSCSGTGARKGTEPQTCPKCRGAGQIAHSQGFFTISTTCPYCQGTGQHIPHPCTECHGLGQVRQSKKLSVKIPPGVDSGLRLLLGGEGEAGERGGPPGDLYVFLRVKSHELFVREGENIRCEIPIGMVPAALGGKIRVPTIDGEEEVEIPKGTQSGDTVTLREKGAAHLRTKHRGNQIITFIVQIPKNLTGRQEELLRQFAAASGGNEALAGGETGKKKKKRGFFG
ncbi:MAG: molecular chaperone DnaJ [Deltaproteobacteria bacterium]|nr:molecular chaperone DnaJ [Deltaproteobacteria bacterium]